MNQDTPDGEPKAGLPSPLQTGQAPPQSSRNEGRFPSEMLDRVLEVERQRIDSANRRTEVATQVVKASDESDRRQYDYQMAKLSEDSSSEKRKDSLAKTVVLGFGGIAVLFVAGFTGMAFFGNASQSQMALDIIGKIATGGAGFGIISAGMTVVKRLLRGWDGGLEK